MAGISVQISPWEPDDYPNCLTSLDVEFKSHKNREVNEISGACFLRGQRYHSNVLSLCLIFLFHLDLKL